MAELLAWDGVWSEDLIFLTLDTLAEVEANEMKRQQTATLAGIAAAFSKDGAKEFLEEMENVKRESRAARAGQRSLKTGASTSASRMIEVLKKMGLSVPRGRR